MLVANMAFGATIHDSSLTYTIGQAVSTSTWTLLNDTSCGYNAFSLVSSYSPVVEIDGIYETWPNPRDTNDNYSGIAYTNNEWNGKKYWVEDRTNPQDDNHLFRWVFSSNLGVTYPNILDVLNPLDNTPDPDMRIINNGDLWGVGCEQVGSAIETGDNPFDSDSFQISIFKGKFPHVEKYLGYHEFNGDDRYVENSSMFYTAHDITDHIYTYGMPDTYEGFYWIAFSRNVSTVSNVWMYNQPNAISFYVADGGAMIYAITDLSELPIDDPKVTCELLDFGCWLGQVLRFLFIPTSTSISNFGTLKGKIENKPPFAYFYIIKNEIANISATSSATTTIDTIEIPEIIKDLIFDPLKLGLAGLIWFVGVVYLFIRIKHIQL